MKPWKYFIALLSIGILLVGNEVGIGAQNLADYSIHLGLSEIPIRDVLVDKYNNIYLSVRQFSQAVDAKYFHDKNAKLTTIKTPFHIISISTNFKLHTPTQLFFDEPIVDIGLPIMIVGEEVFLPIGPVLGLLGIDWQIVESGRKPESDLRVEEKPPRPKEEIPVAKEKSPRSKEEVPPEKVPVERERPVLPGTGLKRFGFYLGMSHLSPDVGNLKLKSLWSLFGVARLVVYKRIALELQYDTYESSQNANFLGEQAHVTVERKGLTGYLLYLFPKMRPGSRWVYEAGMGIGQHKFRLYHDSDTMNYHRWLTMDTFEIKFGAEYCFTDNWRMGFDVRGISGNEKVNFSEVGQVIDIDLDGFYAEISQRFCF